MNQIKVILTVLGFLMVAIVSYQRAWMKAESRENDHQKHFKLGKLMKGSLVVWIGTLAIVCIAAYVALHV